MAPSLVERDRELAAIGGILDSAVEGSGRALVIEGDAGVGKTRLLDEAARLAREGGIEPLRARGAELERAFAFGAMRQLLERTVADLGDAEREQLLSGAAEPASELLGGTMAPGPPPRDARFAFIHALYWVCARLADRHPLAVLIDDFQWLDSPSAEALAYLVERIEDVPAAVMLVVRTGVGAPLGGAHRLHTSQRAAGITVSPLSEAGTRRVLTELLGSHESDFGATAHQVTAGNPFLLRELALAVASEGLDTGSRGAGRIGELVPATVTHWALGRLETLPDAARRLARSLAILDEAELPVAASHAGVAVAEAADAVEALAAAGLVEGNPLSLTHPLVRTALRDDIPEATRDLAHRRAAEVLRDSGAPPALIASQLLRCGSSGEAWAADALRAAAVVAGARGDPEEAVGLLRRAHAELGSDDPQLLVELGQAEVAVGDHRRAIEHLDHVATQAADPGLRLGARVGLAHAHYVAGSFRSAVDAATEVLDAIPAGAGGRLEAELLMSFLMAARAIPELVPGLARWREQPRLGPGGELTAAELVRLETGALDAFLRGRRDEAADLVTRVEGALGTAVPLADVPTLLPGGVGFILAGLGEPERAASVYERALEHVLTRGSPLETVEVLEGRVSARWWRGDVGGCLADVEAIHSLVGREPDPAKLPMRMCQATMLLERGDPAAAEEALAYPVELEERLPGTWGWLALPFGRAAIRLATRDWQAALAEAIEAGRRLAAIEAPSPEFLPWRVAAARAAAGLGDTERALELADEDLERAREIGSPRATGVALTTVGAIARDPEALAEAVAVLEPSGARLAAATARLELGASLRRARHPRDARAPLREALDIALVAGSTVIAERARSELLAAGGRPRRERSTGLDALTSRERQIAELAAAGLGNPEIAERLFVTRKTVESHLRSVFRKLGVRGRDELGGALGVDARD